ncbi:MAG: SPOR domain-containing protein [Bacteroidales bacterium]|nr:SPOR domain-containing protein [Bacteroidales bacterium]
MDLASDIKDLILLNEGVILPGLGGFVTQYHQAEIRKNDNVMKPPSVGIRFDPLMVTDNGLLVSRVAKRNKLSEEEARSVVSEYVESLKKELQGKGTVLIKEVGRIVKGMQGNLSFEPLADKNFHVQSFGLPPVEIPAAARPRETPGRTMSLPVVPPVSEKKVRIPLAAIIIAFVLIGAGAVYFTGLFDRFLKPIFMKPEPVVMINEENPDRIVFGQPVTVDEDTLAMAINQQLSERSSKEKALYYEEPAKKAQPEGETPAVVKQSAFHGVSTEQAVTPSAVTYASGEFCIIAGSFLIPGNADRHKSELEKKGFTPVIIRKNDEFFYVTLQSYDSRETAIAEMRKLRRELDLPLWVMKR